MLTFDKWTWKNRRYLTVRLTINVQTSNTDFINLGMVRVWSSQKAKTNFELVTKMDGIVEQDLIHFVSRVLLKHVLTII